MFVYGTLAPGQPNHGLLEHCGGDWEPATLKGYLVDAGWGAEMGYPGIIPSADGDNVEGYVLTSTELAAEWQRLDAFEGSAYERRQVSVRLARGIDVEAHVYALKGDDQAI